MKKLFTISLFVAVILSGMSLSACTDEAVVPRDADAGDTNPPTPPGGGSSSTDPFGDKSKP